METAIKPTSLQAPITGNSSLEEILKIFNEQFRNKQVVKLSSAADRKKKLKLLKETIMQHREEIQKAIYNDFRKPSVEVDYAEIYPAISEIKLAIENIEDWMAPVEVDTPIIYLGTVSEVVIEPKGNCLILTPWNYPFQLPISHLVSCVAAGNVAIIKPSEFTPHAAAILKKILNLVFAENEVAVIEGDHTVSTELLKLKFDHIHFTGSPAVGKIVMRAAAEHLTTVTLELGG
jgi:aldehyde dehydrogenase (NAD+)